jgi:hypothetical protein
VLRKYKFKIRTLENHKGYGTQAQSCCSLWLRQAGDSVGHPPVTRVRNRKRLTVREGLTVAITFMARAMLFEKTVDGRFENMNDDLHYIEHLEQLVVDSVLQ